MLEPSSDPIKMGLVIQVTLAVIVTVIKLAALFEYLMNHP